jgi:phage baseplate assembly protein W
MAMNLELEQQLRRRILGWGLACDPIYPGLDLGQDLKMTVDTNGRRDFARVEAMDNLSQSLEFALTTLLGSDIFNTRFGFDGLNALVEETNPVLMRERVRIAIIQVLRQDPRIRRIVDLKLLDARLDRPDASTDNNLSPEERLERWRTLDVRVVFETISGDETSINLGVNLGSVNANARF